MFCMAILLVFPILNFIESILCGSVDLEFSSTSQFLSSTLSWPPDLQRELKTFMASSSENIEKIQKVYRSCAKKKQINPVKIENNAFHLNQPKFCDEHKNLWMLIAVHSHPANIYRRNLIRSTWGSMNRVSNHELATLFFLGKTNDYNEQKLLEDENIYYRDIIQRNFTESYYNMTRKHMTVMEWLTWNHCTSLSYVIKSDDDTFIDIFHVVQLLETENFNLDWQFYCSATRNAKPTRPGKSKSSKWEISLKEFPGDVFPTYCEGFGYIMKADLPPYLYWCSMFQPFIWIDDVYVTGILAQNLDIKRVPFLSGHAYERVEAKSINGALLDNIFLTSFYSEFLPNTFRKLWHEAIKFNMKVN